MEESDSESSDDYSERSMAISALKSLLGDTIKVQKHWNEEKQRLTRYLSPVAEHNSPKSEPEPPREKSKEDAIRIVAILQLQDQEEDEIDFHEADDTGQEEQEEGRRRKIRVSSADASVRL